MAWSDMVSLTPTTTAPPAKRQPIVGTIADARPDTRPAA